MSLNDMHPFRPSGHLLCTHRAAQLLHTSRKGRSHLDPLSPRILLLSSRAVASCVRWNKSLLQKSTIFDCFCCGHRNPVTLNCFVSHFTIPTAPTSSVSWLILCEWLTVNCLLLLHNIEIHLFYKLFVSREIWGVLHAWKQVFKCVGLATLHTTVLTLNATGRHVGCASVAIVAGG